MKLFSLLTRFRWIILTAGILKWMSFQVWIIHSWFGMDFELAVWDSAISNVLLLGIGSVLINILTHYVPGFGKFWFALGLSFFLSLGWMWVVNETMAGLADNNSLYGNFLADSYPIRWCIGFLMMAGVSISSIFYNQLKEQQEESRRQADTMAMVREAELQKLQLQLQPHFLYNSLNSINALIGVRPDDAQTMVEQLSEFLRITSKRADEHWIKFEEEWRYVELYLAIERVRFGHRLEIKKEIDGPAMERIIPTLMLQPLIENAIKFGLYGTTGTVTIGIDAIIKEELLSIRITNPFDPDMQPKSGSGFGLSGLRRRLYLLFARNDLLETEVTNSNFSVLLKIPKAHV